MVLFIEILKSQVHCPAEDSILESPDIVCTEFTGIEFTAQCAGQV